MKESNQNNNLITALYCRLSVEDMRMGESMSIENQRLMLTEYAEQHGFKNTKLYIDDGYSGTNNSRPAYVELMNDVYAEKVGTVIVKDQSRLGRDHLETDKLLELVFPSYDVRFIAITDGVDSINGFNDMTTMRNWFNDFYARDTSKKIRAVQRAKGERGERVGTTIPYGYMKAPDNPKQLMPDPETAPIVKRIFEMSAGGYGVRKICDTLSAEKVVCPSVYAYRKYGAAAGRPSLDKPYHWALTTVRKMLANQTYCGDTINFKTYSKSNKLKKRLKNDPKNIMIFKDTHEPIISRQTFDLVQKHYEGRKRPDKLGNIDKYAGYLYCGDCGSRLYLRQSRNMDTRKNNYMCSGYTRRTSECSAHYIKATVLDRLVLTALREMTAYAREHSEDFCRQFMANGENAAKKRLKESEKLKAEYAARLGQLDAIIRTLYEDRVIGRITPERYDQLSSGYEQEQADIKAKLEQLESEIDTAKVREACISEFIAKAKEYVEMPEVTPELLRIFIRRIDV
ncbi:Site-specific DNA recombinase [Ruminococcaceae bacterium FB2012]|nr:Site-specific DNA recombinase [Ruminococcaceae bacterium FB2012]